MQSICESGDKGTPVALDENTVTGRAFLQLAAAVVRQGRPQKYGNGADTELWKCINKHGYFLMKKEQLPGDG